MLKQLINRMTFTVVIEARYYNSSCSKKTLTLQPLMQLSILITIFHAHKFCVLYQRVGRHSIQEWCRHVTYTILDQKPRKINYECVKAQTSSQCMYSFSDFTTSKAHKLSQGTVEELTSVLLNPERRGEERKGGCNRCGQLEGMIPTALAIEGPFYKCCSN